MSAQHIVVASGWGWGCYETRMIDCGCHETHNIDCGCSETHTGAHISRMRVPWLFFFLSWSLYPWISADSSVAWCWSMKVRYRSVFHGLFRPFESEASSCGCHLMATHSDQNNIENLSVSCCVDLVCMQSNVMRSLVFTDYGDIQNRWSTRKMCGSMNFPL
jgi:hypothetical protein